MNHTEQELMKQIEEEDVKFLCLGKKVVVIICPRLAHEHTAQEGDASQQQTGL